MKRPLGALSCSILALSLVVMLAACGSSAGTSGTSPQDDAGADPADVAVADSGGQQDVPAGADSGSADVLSCEQDSDCEGFGVELGACEVVVCDKVKGVCARGQRQDQSPCDDGDPCTTGSVCLSGVCEAGTAYSCEDDDPCTEDTCDGQGGCEHAPAAAGVTCDDDNPCTGNDACDGAGLCVGEDNGSCDPCVVDEDCRQWDDGDLCNGVLGCVDGRCELRQGSAVVCDTSGDPRCGRTVCQPDTGECALENLPDGTSCDDGDPCTSEDVCAAGECAGSPIECPCQSDDDCAELEDGDLCNGTLACVDGSCALDPETVVTCQDENLDDCTAPRCEPTTGQCDPRPVTDGAACDDGDPCTPFAGCAAGECVGTGQLDCSDGDPCTDDVCDPAAGGCVHPHNTAPCEDGDACTVDDVCAAGVCQSGGARACDDGDPCTEDSCDSEAGCIGAPLSGVPCDDGQACTGNDADPDHCEEGVCVGGALVCDCASDQDCAPFEDGDLCNGTLRCLDDTCAVDPATIVTCPDNADTECRRNTCVPATGSCEMSAVEDGLICDDGDDCTTADSCQAGVCVSGAQMVCSDGDDCTQDSCQGGVCVFDPIPGCVGACTRDGDCVDDDPCTLDICGADGECENTTLPDGAACEDGNPCTGGDQCLGGACVSGDGNPCGGQCVPAAALTCGATLEGATWDFSATMFMQSYPCVAGDWSGFEMAYTFVAQASFSVTARLTGDSMPGLGLMVLLNDGDGCDPLRCVVGDPDGGPVTWSVEEGQTYFLVVDGDAMTSGAFELSVSCDSGEDCTNGQDDDGDMLIDCADPECSTVLACMERDCANGVDDDEDGEADCDDTDCFADPLCLPEGACADGVDEDGDGLTDCDDPDCDVEVYCRPEADCQNRVDDDLDGATDCLDPDCFGLPECVESECRNGVDDDRDGTTDCADADCEGATGCVEVLCGNGADDDGDGAADCADSDCDGTPNCSEVDCDDGVDNEHDGRTDCDDPECADVFPCSSLCVPAAQVRCGDILVGESSSGGDRQFADYPDCDGLSGLTGAERVYAYYPEQGRQVTFTVRAPDFDAAIVALEGACRPPTACVAAGDDGGEGAGEAVSLYAQGNQPLYFVVEGVGGDSGSFDVLLSCSGEPESACDNGVDDDVDGRVDCDDPDCYSIAPCAESDCTNGLDDNGDGTVDCADPSCASEPACGEFDCANGVDDDGDGDVDCDDIECFNHPACGERCANGQDDDGDELIDCMDPDCVGDPACVEDCSNGVDDEGDGLADCDDPDCVADSSCTESDCANGADDDGDGDVDCGDLDCVFTDECREQDCGNGVDDDGDGEADCADADCAADPRCSEIACANGVDDDGDGRVDCADSDCVESGPCTDIVCRPERVLGCGVLTGQSFTDASATDVIDLWPSCDLSGFDHSGAEMAYRFVATCTGIYNFAVIPASPGEGFLDLFLLEGEQACAESACVNVAYGGPMGAGLDNVEILAGQTYTLVVDGVDGYEGPFEVEAACGCTPTSETACGDGVDDDDDGFVDCMDDDCIGDDACSLTCSPITELSCGERASALIGGPGSTAVFDAYPACDPLSLDYSGAEVAFSFESVCSGPVTVTTTRTSGSGNLDTFVLRADATGRCVDDNCVAAGYMGGSGVGQLAFGAVEGARYFVVVDSGPFDSGAFSVSAACGCLGESSCNDGQDEDGDGRIDCQDPDCLDDPVCQTTSSCNAGASIVCDDPIDGDTATSGSSQVATYACKENLAEDGPEDIYRWTSPATGSVGVTLDIQGGQDLDLFVLEDYGVGCTPDACIASSTDQGDESLVFEAVEGRTYYIVVDGYNGAAGPYRLNVDCSPGCDSVDELVCGVPVDDDLGGDVATDLVSSYSCDADGFDYSGPEMAYGFMAPCTGTVSVQVTSLSVEPTLLDVFALPIGVSCDGSCFASGKMNAGSRRAVMRLDVTEGDLYQVVVDGREGASAPFRIELECEECLSGDPCWGAQPITCGGSFTGSSAQGEAFFDFYGCTPWAWPGGELWRVFEPTTDATVTLELSSDSGHGVFVIEESGGICEPFACVAGTDFIRPELVSFDAAAGSRYYIVVDNPTDDPGPFALDLECL